MISTDVFVANQQDMIRRQEKDIEEFTELIMESVPKFSKKHFEEHFLSYFLSGDLTEEMITVWVSKVAKSPTMPVALVDDDTGEVVVYAPAILDSSKLDVDPGPDSSKTIESSILRYQQTAYNNPGLATSTLRRSLEDHLEEHTVKSSVADKFFEYYKDYVIDGEVAKPKEEVGEEFDRESLFE